MVCCKGIWSSGMILASGARGLEFDSRNAPCNSTPFILEVLEVEDMNLEVIEQLVVLALVVSLGPLVIVF